MKKKKNTNDLEDSEKKWSWKKNILNNNWYFIITIWKGI